MKYIFASQVESLADLIHIFQCSLYEHYWVTRKSVKVHSFRKAFWDLFAVQYRSRWEATLPAHWYSSSHDWCSLIVPLDVLNDSLQVLCVGRTVRPRRLSRTGRWSERPVLPFKACFPQKPCSHMQLLQNMFVILEHDFKVILGSWQLFGVSDELLYIVSNFSNLSLQAQ